VHSVSTLAENAENSLTVLKPSAWSK
jgi:hypothetical protein